MNKNDNLFYNKLFLKFRYLRLELTLMYDNTIAVLLCQHIYTLVKTNSF
jgi:hypothetical protein